tara:strand:- start:31808 stop:32065 length:258 start_codon:yes stop_codon:yes gene_type:complete
MSSADIPFEHPDDPKPVSKDALRARKAAIRDGTLIAPARDTLAREAAAEPAPMIVVELEAVELVEDVEDVEDVEVTEQETGEGEG